MRRFVRLSRSLIAADVFVMATTRLQAPTSAEDDFKCTLKRVKRKVRAVFPSRYTFCIIAITFLGVLPALCLSLGLRHSLYYQMFSLLIHHPLINTASAAAAEDGRLLGDLIVENERRVESAKRYLEERLLSLHHRASADEKRTPDHQSRLHGHVIVTIAVTLISSRRDAFISGNHDNDGFRFIPNFLVQNAARFLKQIDANARPDGFEYQLSVCSVGDQLTPEEAYLAQVVSVFRERMNETNGRVGEERFGPWHDRLAWRFEKEKLDYVFCIRETLRQHESRDHPLYVLLVEDDSLPKTEALSVIERLVSGHWSSRTDDRPLSYVKLFHPPHLHGYVSLRVDAIGQLISIALILGTLSHVLAQSFSLRHRPSWLGSCAFFAALALAVGRVHLDRPWRRCLSPYAHYLVADGFCCTQALLYSRRTADRVADYLDRTRCNETFHKDDALWSFGRSNSHIEESALVQPNLFEHVGFYSGLRAGFIDPHVFDWD